MPRRHGKVQPVRQTVGSTIREFFSSKKIEYGEDNLLTDRSVRFLKNYFQADGYYAKDRRSASHTSSHAGNMSDPQLVDKLILVDPTLTTKYKTISTQFKNERQQWTAILDTLCEQDDKWINEHQHYTVRNGSQFHYTTETDGVMDSPANNYIEPCEQTTGFTIANRLIYKCDTGAYATVVTTRNKDIPIGFSIHTAYPGLSYDPNEETNDKQCNLETMDADKRRRFMKLYSGDYTDIMRQTEAYASTRSVMAKASILMQGRSDAVFGEGLVPTDGIKDKNISLSGIKQNPRDGSEYFTFTKYNKDGTSYRLTVKEDDVVVHKYDTDRRTPITFTNDTNYEARSAGRSRNTLRYIKDTLPEMYKAALAAEECIAIAKADVQEERTRNRAALAEQNTASVTKERQLVGLAR